MRMKAERLTPHTARRMSSNFFSSERAKSAAAYSPRRLFLEATGVGSIMVSSLGLKSWRFS